MPVILTDYKPDPQFRRGDRSIGGISSIGGRSWNDDSRILFHAVNPNEKPVGRTVVRRRLDKRTTMKDERHAICIITLVLPRQRRRQNSTLRR